MANGTLAASQFEMLSQSGTGIITVVPPATNTNRTLTLPDVTGTLSTLGMGTAVSASGTAVDFTGIPAGVKRITVMFANVSTNGTSIYLLRIGSGSIDATGYVGGYSAVLSGLTGSASQTAGFAWSVHGSASSVVQGAMVLTNIAGNTWVCHGNGWDAQNSRGMIVAGSKDLSGVLDQVRITTVNGTDTFDAGTINIMYEG